MLHEFSYYPTSFYYNNLHHKLQQIQPKQVLNSVRHLRLENI